jgi:single-strand DNA-binding protein
MASVNKVILVGNLTRDPQVRQLPSGGFVADFSLAMNRRFTNPRTNEPQEETCFVDCATFGRLAEVVRDYCHKGELLFVEGRLRQESWEDKNAPGVRRSKLSVYVEGLQLLSRRGDNAGAPMQSAGYGQHPGAAYGQPSQYAPQPQQYAAPQQYGQQPYNGAAQQGGYQPQPVPPPMPAFQSAPEPPPAGESPLDDVPF